MKINNDIKASSDFLKDESQLVGNADKIIFCHTTEDVERVVSDCYKDNLPLTIQGALTGICGGAVPLNGVAINLSEMDGIIGMSYDRNLKKYTIRVQPGLSLKELNHLLKTKRFDLSNFNYDSLKVYNQFKNDKSFMFAPDPTETLASIGGMVACDASGACSYKYGSIRNHIQGLTLVTSQKKITINRGDYKYNDLDNLLQGNNFPLPMWKTYPSDLKNVAGLYYNKDMDLIDLIIGSEGVFGIVTEIEVSLQEEPNIKAGIMLFLEHENKIIEFIDTLRNDKSTIYNNSIAAIEYFDSDSLNLLQEFKEINPSLKKLPAISSDYDGSIYLEFHLDSEEELDEMLELISDELIKYGINENNQWLALESSDFEKLKLFRHAVPECVNILIANKKQSDNRINKVGTDMSVPAHLLSETILMYKSDIMDIGVRSVIFGHIGDSNLHVNLIPSTYNQFVLAKETIKKWANYVTVNGGSVSAEHGIGKLKKELLKIMINDEDLQSMRQIKTLLDPKELINQGTLLD